MARNKTTYGRKPVKQSTFANDCFANTSSPLQAAEVALDDAPRLPSPRIKQQCKAAAGGYERASETAWEYVVEGLQGLLIEDSEDAASVVDGPPDSPSRNTRGRRALQARDVNTVVNKSHLMKSLHTSEAHKQPEAEQFLSDKHRARHEFSPLASLQAQPMANETSPFAKVGADDPEPDALVSYAQALLSLASEATLVSFSDYATALASHFDITKLAEASYGEVYRLSLLPSTSTHLRTAFSHTDESVLKLIALKPPPTPLPTTLTAAGKKRRKLQWTKAEQERMTFMSRVEDVAGEVRLLKRMSCVPGFTNFRALTVLRGPLPPPFLSAWSNYDENVKRSEFPNPASPGAYFDDDQLWAMIEMQDAGRDLEAVVMKSVWSVWDAFWGIAVAIAKGEEWARYEHRDLHLGNICVKWDDTGTNSDNINAPPVDLGKKLGYTGLETTIIDYTLSRADMETTLQTGLECSSPSLRLPSTTTAPTSLLAEDNDVKKSVAYLDLSLDSSLFEGDATEEYQYEIYRCMRSAAQYADPLDYQHQNERKAMQADRTATWKQSHPLTNLVWLHFVLYKLCEGVDLWPSNSTKSKPVYSSRPVLKHAKGIERKLSTLEAVLALENMNRSLDGDPDGLGSASDLVAWAVQEGWLDEEDVVACGLGKSDLREEDTLLELVEGLTMNDDDEPAAKSSEKTGRRRKNKRTRHGDTKTGGDVL